MHLPRVNAGHPCLPPPSRERPSLETPFAAPTTAMETELVLVWSEILAIDEIGIHDDIFALGGDSISAARIVGRVRTTFGVDVPLATAFEAPTIARLAELIRETAARPAEATPQTSPTRVARRKSAGNR